MRRILLPLLFVAAVLACAGSAAAQAKIIYVDDDVPAPGDGTSWATAYRSIQAALDAAPAEASLEIRVAQGLYRPNESTDLSGRYHDPTFLLPDGTTLRGGYAGLGAPDPNAWSPEDHETILTGDLQGDDLPLPDPPIQLEYQSLYELNREDNTTSVVAPVWGGAEIVLEGVVITAASPGRPGMHVLFPGAGLYVGYNARYCAKVCLPGERRAGHLL